MAIAVCDEIFGFSRGLKAPANWKILAALTLMIPVFMKLFIYYQLVGNYIWGVQMIESGSFHQIGRDIFSGVYFRGLIHIYNSMIDFSLVGLFLKLKLVGISTLPYVTSCLSILTIPATYYLARKLFNHRVGLLAAFFMGMSFWSNFEFTWLFAFQDPVFFTFSYLTFLTALERNDKKWYLLTGILVGIGFLFRFFPPFPLVIMFFVLRYRKPKGRGRTFGWIMIGFFLALAPVIYDVVTINPTWVTDFFLIMAVKGVSSVPLVLGVHTRLIQTLIPLGQIAMDPPFFIFTLVFFLGGLGLLIQKWHRGRKFTPGEGFTGIWVWVTILMLVFAFSYTDKSLGGIIIRPTRHYALLFPAPYILAGYFLTQWSLPVRVLAWIRRFFSRRLFVYAGLIAGLCWGMVLLSGHIGGMFLRDEPWLHVPLPNESEIISNFPLSHIHSAMRDMRVEVSWGGFKEKYMDFSVRKAWWMKKGEYFKYPHHYYDDLITRGGAIFDYDFDGKKVHNHLIFGSFPVVDFQGLRQFGRVTGPDRDIYLAIMGPWGIQHTNFMGRIRSRYHLPVIGLNYADWVKRYNPRELELIYRDEKLDVTYFLARVPRVRFQNARFRFRSYPQDPMPGVIPVSLGNAYMDFLGFGTGHCLSHFWAFRFDPQNKMDGLFLSEYRNDFNVNVDPGEYEVELELDVSADGGPRVCAGGECAEIKRPAARKIPEGQKDLTGKQGWELMPYIELGKETGVSLPAYYFEPFKVRMRIRAQDRLTVVFEPKTGWILVRELTVRRIEPGS